MQTLLILLLVSYLLYRAGTDPRTSTPVSSRSQSVFSVVGGVLVLLALFVVINPEARLMLMFIDSIGVDLFLTMCVLYLRHHLMISATLVLLPALRAAYRFGLVAGFWPSRDVMHSMPAFATYAIAWPIAFLLLITGCITLVILIGASLARLG